MKLRRLDLLAFGPFTDQHLLLDGDGQRLHIVYGANEAGKSSSLRAIRQLLFGIPNNSGDNFLHPYPKLRIGGVLETSNGQTLEVVRRKGTKNTLLDTSNNPIDSSRVREMLAGVDENTFRQRFGIDYAELVSGGRAIVAGSGNLGEILYAAGAGIADLGAIQTSLADEADALFKFRGSNQSINRAVSEFADAKRKIKEAQLPTAQWVTHDKELREAEKRLGAIDQQLLEKRAEHSRLERIDKALPLIVRRRRIEEQLAEVAGTPLLPNGFSGDRREAVSELGTARQAEQDASRETESLQAAIASLNVPSGVLEHRTAITRLHSELGSYQKAAHDRPGLVARLENAEQQARTILQVLGREPELQQAERLRLSRVQRDRIQSLARDCSARVDRQMSADLAVGAMRKETAQAESQLASLAASQDAGPLKRAIHRAQRHGDLDQQFAEAQAALRQLEKQAEVDLYKLRLWSGTLEQLEQLPVPAQETIDRFDHELADAVSLVQRMKERGNELTRQVQKLDRSLERLQLELDVPTEDDLVCARRRRDDGWQLVRQALRDGLPAGDRATVEFIQEFSAGGDLAQAFQASVEAADRLADRLRREADRVAEKARLTTDRQDVERQLVEQKAGLKSAEKALESWRSQWREQWTSLGADPLSPREMRSWSNQQQALTRTAEAIRKQHDRVSETGTLIRSLRKELCQCLEQLDQPLPNQDEQLSRMVEYCETIVGQIGLASQQRLECDRLLAKLNKDLAAAERHADQAKGDLEHWRIQWSEAVAVIGLDRDAAPSEANSVIESVDELFGLLKEAGDVRTRIEGIDRDADEFKQSVQRLVTQVAQDLSELQVEQVIADLYDRLESASTSQAKLDGWKEQLENERAKRDRARSKVEQLQAKIELMCRQADCTSADDLPAAEENSARRGDLEKELEAVSEQLDGLAAGGSLGDLTVAAEQFDPDRLRAELQTLGEEISRLDGERTEVAKSIGGYDNELRRMDGSARAAEALENAEHLAARIRSDTEQFVRLKLASAVLRRAIDRFREKNQGPVLRRASDLFSELTLGSFAGLRADYDDKGEAVLVGIRSGGRHAVGVQGLSEGSESQLYLALRLAMLEAHLAAHEPIPFIVDDILKDFDDDRAVAALKALAGLSEKTQVILFTHHKHLVTLAEENLDDDVVFVRSLCSRERTIPPRKQGGFAR